MVEGITKFQEYFKEFTDQYVLIGGTACSISFDSYGIDFGRRTKDLDVVLVVEAQTREFGERFWQFIRDGGYRNKASSSGCPQFYRFDHPTNPTFPAMIELFSRTDYVLNKTGILTPLHIDDNVSSLSAILLDENYYRALLEGREIIDGVSVLKSEWLIAFKAKAWLDLIGRPGADEKDIRKHRNDIVRMVSKVPLGFCKLPNSVQSDLERFIERFEMTEAELKNPGVRKMNADIIKDTLRFMGFKDQHRTQLLFESDSIDMHVLRRF